ncbi:hypothetical protein HDV57DRAFT_236235 [Trichoderma longibrachiatum]
MARQHADRSKSLCAGTCHAGTKQYRRARARVGGKPRNDCPGPAFLNHLRSTGTSASTNDAQLPAVYQGTGTAYTCHSEAAENVRCLARHCPSLEHEWRGYNWISRWLAAGRSSNKVLDARGEGFHSIASSARSFRSVHSQHSSATGYPAMGASGKGQSVEETWNEGGNRKKRTRTKDGKQSTWRSCECRWAALAASSTWLVTVDLSEHLRASYGMPWMLFLTLWWHYIQRR